MLDVSDTAVLMSVCLHGKCGVAGGGRHVHERGRGWGEAWGVLFEGIALC
ncbi:hypothetical protein [Bartonella queenslandensis]|nr:hypothetical protein [Bartonella queenslandensis]